MVLLDHRRTTHVRLLRYPPPALGSGQHIDGNVWDTPTTKRLRTVGLVPLKGITRASDPPRVPSRREHQSYGAGVTPPGFTLSNYRGYIFYIRLAQVTLYRIDREKYFFCR